MDNVATRSRARPNKTGKSGRSATFSPDFNSVGVRKQIRKRFVGRKGSSKRRDTGWGTDVEELRLTCGSRAPFNCQIDSRLGFAPGRSKTVLPEFNDGGGEGLERRVVSKENMNIEMETTAGRYREPIQMHGTENKRTRPINQAAGTIFSRACRLENSGIMALVTQFALWSAGTGRVARHAAHDVSEPSPKYVRGLSLGKRDGLARHECEAPREHREIHTAHTVSPNMIFVIFTAPFHRIS